MCSCVSSNIFIIIPCYKLQFPSYLLFYLVYVLFFVVWNCSVSFLSCAAQSLRCSPRGSAETLVADSVCDYFFLSWSDSKRSRSLFTFLDLLLRSSYYHLQIFAVGPANVCLVPLPHRGHWREGICFYCSKCSATSLLLLAFVIITFRVALHFNVIVPGLSDHPLLLVHIVTFGLRLPCPLL